MTGRSTTKGLVLLHEEYAPAGMIGERAGHHGIDLDTVFPPSDGVPDVTAFDVLLVMGATSSVTDRSTTPWIEEEIAAVRKAVEADVPVLGICFGGQVLAAALGGAVRVAPALEIGWVPITTDDPDRVPAGPWVAWHEDLLSVPPGAAEIARNAVGPQAFAYGRHLGVQFHPEVDLPIMEEWIVRGREYIGRAGLEAEQVRAETVRQQQRARRDAYRLFDGFWERARG